MLESYKQSIDKNKIPPGLLDSTAEKMRRTLEMPVEDAGQNSVGEKQKYADLFSSRKASRKNWSRAILAAAAVLVVVLLLPLSNQSVIRTPLDPNGYQETVELKDGVLYFGIQARQEMDIKHNFGFSSSINKWTIAEYRDYLGLVVLPGDEIENYKMVEQVIRIQTNMNEEVLGDELIRDYVGENDESFTLTLSKSQKKDWTGESVSMIGDSPVVVSKGNGQNEYYGQFSTGEIICTIETSNMTQEDFILLLYELGR